jgi:hypothetical protein
MVLQTGEARQKKTFPARTLPTDLFRLYFQW